MYTKYEKEKAYLVIDIIAIYQVYLKEKKKVIDGILRFLSENGLEMRNCRSITRSSGELNIECNAFMFLGFYSN